ncbi:MAG: cbb3-type cytochrome c oxidase subunit I, partial [Planctomycetota bacterium]
MNRWLRDFVFVDDPAKLGRRYLVVTMICFAVGGLLAMAMRWKLAWPDAAVPVIGELFDWPGGVMPPEVYSRAFTLHGTVMIWLTLVPLAAWGLGLACVPRLCGVRSPALKFAGGWSLWWLIVGAAILLVAWTGGANAGWTAYAPLGSTEAIAGGRWVNREPDVASWLRLHGDVGYPVQSRWPAFVLYAVFVALAGWLGFVGSRVATLLRTDRAKVAASLRDAGDNQASSNTQNVLLHPVAMQLPRVVVALFVFGLAWLLTLGLQIVVFEGQTAWFFVVGWLATGGMLAAASLLTTVVTRRRPGRLPLAVWGWATAAAVGLLASPVIVLAMTMNLLDSHGLTEFFHADGQPLLHQHLFWFYGHPLVYLMILPAFGLVTDTLARASRQPAGGAWGYRMMAGSTVAIGGLGFAVWAHHMFQSGLNPSAALVFSAAT